MTKINISHVNNMHNYWLRSLNFYKTEFTILRGILTEIAGKNSNSDAMKEVEHFENQFKVQNQNIDKLTRDIHVNINAIGIAAQHAGAGYIDGGLVTEHNSLVEQAAQLEKICGGLFPSF